MCLPFVLPFKSISLKLPEGNPLFITARLITLRPNLQETKQCLPLMFSIRLIYGVMWRSGEYPVIHTTSHNYVQICTKQCTNIGIIAGWISHKHNNKSFRKLLRSQMFGLNQPTNSSSVRLAPVDRLALAWNINPDHDIDLYTRSSDDLYAIKFLLLDWLMNNISNLKQVY